MTAILSATVWILIGSLLILGGYKKYLEKFGVKFSTVLSRRQWLYVGIVLILKGLLDLGQGSGVI